MKLVCKIGLHGRRRCPHSIHPHLQPRTHSFVGVEPMKPLPAAGSSVYTCSSSGIMPRRCAFFMLISISLSRSHPRRSHCPSFMRTFLKTIFLHSNGVIAEKTFARSLPPRVSKSQAPSLHRSSCACSVFLSTLTHHVDAVAFVVISQHSSNTSSSNNSIFFQNSL